MRSYDGRGITTGSCPFVHPEVAIMYFFMMVGHIRRQWRLLALTALLLLVSMNLLQPTCCGHGDYSIFLNPDVAVQETRCNLMEQLPSTRNQRSSLPDVLLDLHRPQYLHFSDVCADSSGEAAEEILFLFVVVSNPRSSVLRDQHRRGAPAEVLRTFGTRRLFVFGDPEDVPGPLAEAVAEEVRWHGDIVQGNFRDSYRNMTYMHALALHFAVTACAQVRFVVKMDDDIAVDWYRLMKMMQDLPSAEVGHLLAGIPLRRAPVVRDPGHKWFVSRQEFEPEVFPDYLSGWLYITTPEVCRVLLNKSRTLPRLWMDDVFLMGIVRQAAGISLSELSRNAVTDRTDCMQQCIDHSGDRYIPLLGFSRSGNTYFCDVILGPSGHNPKLLGDFLHLATKCANLSQMCQHRSPWIGRLATCQNWLY